MIKFIEKKKAKKRMMTITGCEKPNYINGHWYPCMKCKTCKEKIIEHKRKKGEIK